MYAKDKTTVLDQREMLRVKLKSLAAEARIIRHEEQRTNGWLRERLRAHRVGIVRRTARETHIAYGLIKGRTLEQIENVSKTEPNWESINRMLSKYGPIVQMQVAQAA